MKYITLLLVFIGINAHCEIENDKKLHLTSTMFISSTASVVAKQYGSSRFDSAMAGIMTANLIGVAKELSDPVFDSEDVAYNLLGSLIGSVAVWEF